MRGRGKGRRGGEQRGKGRRGGEHCFIITTRSGKKDLSFIEGSIY